MEWFVAVFVVAVIIAILMRAGRKHPASPSVIPFEKKSEGDQHDHPH